jgi:hypothetical protein
MLDESYVAAEARRVHASTRRDNEFVCTAGFLRQHLTDRR